MTDENFINDRIEYAFSKSNTLVLVGAMDGVAFDEFYPFIMKWGHQLTTAVFVEPIPWWFEKLKETYKQFPHFNLENSAISLQKGEQKMVTIDPNKDHYSEDPDGRLQNIGWIYGCSMFGETFTNLIGITDKDVEHMKDYLTVPTLSFSDLVEKYQVETIDLLKIDTEGQDWNIFKQVDLRKYKPYIILYEAAHLSQSDKEAAVEHCKSAGYKMLLEGNLMVWEKM